MLGTIMPVSLRAQAPGGAAQPAREAVANTQIVVNGGQVTITYDLIESAAPGTFSVLLAISQDEGRTYALTPTAVSGDIGPGVAPGIGKRIVWDAARDIESLQFDRLRFRVTATQTTSAAPAGGATGSTAPPGAQRPGPPARPPQQPAAKSSRGTSLLFSSLALLAGGVALGGAAGAGPLKKDDPFYSDCSTYYGADNCVSLSRSQPNKPLSYAGMGMAGLGAVLLIRNAMKSSSPQVVVAPLPKGFVIYRRVPF
jgi:hypothetical protein